MLEDLGFAGKIDREKAQELVDEMLADAAAAGVAPWQKPWDAATGYGSVPRNAGTGRPYSGQNAMMLSLFQEMMGTSDGRWMTFKQMESAGYSFRADRGERRVKGVPLVIIKPFPKKDANKQPVLDPKGNQVFGRYASTFFVFHVSDMDGVPEPEAPPAPTFEPAEAVQDVIARSGANIRYVGGDSAHYSPGSDTITLPELGQFHDQRAFTRTALHELAHWTGAEGRLDRADAAEARRFGDMHYAKEELVADISAYLTAVELGIDYDPGDHASYTTGWAQKTGDRDAIRKAVSQAQAATRYLVDGTGTKADSDGE